MDIKVSKQGLVQLSGKEQKVFLGLTGFDHKPEAEAINIGNFNNGISSNVISSTGEYEIGDVEVMAWEARKTREGKANIFKVVLDEIHLSYIHAPLEDMDKQGWDLINGAHLVLINFEEKYKDLSKVINKLSPHVVIALGGEKSVVEKATDLQVAGTESQYKFDSKDFAEDEPVTKLYILSN
jgi:hypothetical protein